MASPGRLFLCLALLAIVGESASARADDLADEAELAFSLGARAYQRGDYRAALQQFLLSNRLVPNRNVVFNIACAYEALSLYPEAHRYYTTALEGETDSEARAKIQAALDKLSSKVAVLRIETNPPGATLFLDRKDLGSRGQSPRRLGVTPGSYKVIAELPGYEPAEFAISSVKAGEEMPVELVLVQITATLAVMGPPGGDVRLDQPHGAPSCQAPCVLRLPPGPHQVYVDKPGYRIRPVAVDLAPRAQTVIAPETQPQTGTLVVSTDEPGAELRVDGQTRGFTPILVSLPAGQHAVSATLAGFREIDVTAVVAEDRETTLSLEFVPTNEVIAASRVSERVEQAPSSVSIVSRDELQAFAYPTIVEAVRGQPGVYVWDNNSYATVGIRGLGRLGSYGNRLLVLNDGHPMNDNWIGSSYVGYDAMTDLDDIERIEVVRGPGSVLYGTNAFSGVINLVPREREPGVSIAVSTNLDGVARGRVRSDAKLGSIGHLWTSLGAARSEGRSFSFPEDPTESSGAGGAQKDSFKSGTVHGGLSYGALAAQWSCHVYDKRITTGEYETDVLDPRTRQRDTRAFLEVRAEPAASDFVTLLTRAYANLYRFHGEYAHSSAEEGLEVDTYHGQWVGLEQRVVLTPVSGVRITLGGEGQLHYQATQTAEDRGGLYLDDRHPYRVGALYALADADATHDLRLSAGTRYDAYSTVGGSLNPRAALIAAPYHDGTLKFLGGKAFRAPSIYELYYQDGGHTQVASPGLDPESIYSAEVEHTHRFSPKIVGTAAAYANYVHGLVVSRGEGDEAAPLRYVNSGTPLLVTGGEFGIRRDFRQGFMLSASYSLSYARFLEDASWNDVLTIDSDLDSRHVANAPRHLASIRAVAPVFSRTLRAATRFTFEGSRFDRNESRDDEQQTHTKPAVVWDMVLSGENARYGVEYAVGVYNAFDWRYDAPTSFEFRQSALPQRGRTFLTSLEIEL